MEEPGLHVATSRHRDKMFLFAGRDELETPADTHDRGIPRTDTARGRRVIAALAEQAMARSGTANDRPVHDKALRGGPTGGAKRTPIGAYAAADPGWRGSSTVAKGRPRQQASRHM